MRTAPYAKEGWGAVEWRASSSLHGCVRRMRRNSACLTIHTVFCTQISPYHQHNESCMILFSSIFEGEPAPRFGPVWPVLFIWPYLTAWLKHVGITVRGWKKRGKSFPFQTSPFLCILSILFLNLSFSYYWPSFCFLVLISLGKKGAYNCSFFNLNIPFCHHTCVHSFGLSIISIVLSSYNLFFFMMTVKTRK